MSVPLVKGWCPGAHRPMMSGDGLVVRVRPFRAALSSAQAVALCALAQRFGNGTLDLTSRANLQIRGVAEQDHPALLQELDALGLIDADPAVEGHRNILMTPEWAEGDLTDRLYAKLIETLPTLPSLPEKMGFALDTGAEAQLQSGSADFRFETTAEGTLILRADGASHGRITTEATAMDALRDMAKWFVASGGPTAGRMNRHLKQTSLPDTWEEAAPRPNSSGPQIGPQDGGCVLGAPFGAIDAAALEDLLTTSDSTGLRLMLGRQFWLTGAAPDSAPGFVTDPGSPLMQAHACPGAPYCPQASVETRKLATRLAGQVSGILHVSGCAKGCAHPRKADVTLTGRDGAYDLVLKGVPWDDASRTGLAPDTLINLREFT